MSTIGQSLGQVDQPEAKPTVAQPAIAVSETNEVPKVSAFSVRQALNDQEDENALQSVESSQKSIIKPSIPRPADSEISLGDLVSKIST